MEERQFYDAVEYWSAAYTPPLTEERDAFIAKVKRMDRELYGNGPESGCSMYMQRGVTTWDGFRLDLAAMTEQQREMIGQFFASMNYDRFLDTRYWNMIRSRSIVMCDGRCQVCRKSNVALEVHHRNYKYRGREYEHVDELRVLCRQCHGITHEVIQTIRENNG